MDHKTREELERRLDELARKYAETHDPVAKAEVEAISRRIAGMLDN
jgi:predicted transcriptional regulator